jgi:hypothetical protein
MPTDGRGPASLFLLVDPRSAQTLLPPLQDHFRLDSHITVLVERRTSGEHGPGAPAPDRARRRAPVAERDAVRALPNALRLAARDVRLVQPMPPLGRTHEDSDLGALVAGAVAMHPEATSELWWRVGPRVIGRLALRIGEAAAAAAIPSLLGRILDDLATYDPAFAPLRAWLDATVDRYAGDGRTIVQPLVRSSSSERPRRDLAAHSWGTAMERTP